MNASRLPILLLAILLPMVLHAEEKLLATALGQPIYQTTLDVEALRSEILGIMYPKFDQENNIAPTDADRQALLDRLKSLRERQPVVVSAEIYQKPLDQMRPFLDPWIISFQRNKILYQRYGGAVVWQLGSNEPVGAIAQWLRQEERSGRLVFHDTKFKEDFYRYFDAPLRPLNPKDIDLTTPWWLMPEQ